MTNYLSYCRLNKIGNAYHRRWSCQDSSPNRAKNFSQHVDNIRSYIKKFSTPITNSKINSVRHSMQLNSPLNTRNARTHIKSTKSQVSSNMKYTKVSKETFAFQPTVSCFSQIPNNKLFVPSSSIRSSSGFLLRLEDKIKRIMETQEGKEMLQHIQDSKLKVVKDKMNAFKLKSIVIKNHDITKNIMKHTERYKITPTKLRLPKSDYFKHL